MRFVTCVGLLLLAVACAVNATPIQWDANGHYYEWVTDPVTVSVAKTAALGKTYQGLHGHLVTITSDAEQQFINNSVISLNTSGPLSAAWTAAREAGPTYWQDIWHSPYWDSGFSVEQWNYTNWQPGQIRDSCKYMYLNCADSAHFGQWVTELDIWNEQPISHSYIVEYEPDPQPVLNSANGHYYQWIPTSLLWPDARQAAINSSYNGMRGHLVTITSADEQAFVAGMLYAHSAGPLSSVWSAGHELGATGWQDTWHIPTWDSGYGNETWDYTNWNLVNLHDWFKFMAVSTGDGSWNSQPDTSSYSYMIEYEPGQTPVQDTLGGHCYQVIPAALTWSEARAAALACTYNGLSGHLVTITSPAEQQFLINSVLTLNTSGLASSLWTAGHELGSTWWQDTWHTPTWDSGFAIPEDWDYRYEYWQPNMQHDWFKYMSLNCGDSTNFGSWVSEPEVFNDVTIKHGYVVEYEAIPLPIYNEATGHYYEWVSDALLWTDARAAALAKTYNGLQGHLVTITSQDEQTFIETNVISEYDSGPLAGAWTAGHDTGGIQWTEAWLSPTWDSGVGTEVWDYTNWQESQLHGWFKYMALNCNDPSNFGKWFSAPDVFNGSDVKYSYIVEYDPSSYPTISYSNNVSIDGNLSDWSDADWKPFDTDYSGTPYDIGTGSEWAIKWGAGGTKIYIAAKVKDSAQVFTNTYIAWDARDAIEFYLNTTGTDSGPYGTNDYAHYQEQAQQWEVGITNTNRSAVWVNNGSPRGGVPEYGDYIPSSSEVYARGFQSGDWLYYEAEVTPYEYFGGRRGHASVVSPLHSDDIIRADLAAVGCDPTGYTGMKSYNHKGTWSSDYTQFAMHKLTREGVVGTIILSDFAGSMLGTTANVVVTDAQNVSETHNVVIDASGAFSFKTALGGACTAVASASGYMPQSKTITITDGAGSVNFTLGKQANAVSIDDAKKSVRGTMVQFTGSITAVFAGSIYVEVSNRVSGIRADKTNHGFTIADVGKIVTITGSVDKDNSNNEIFVNASQIDPGSSIEIIAPLGMTNKASGGGNFTDQTSGNGQIGVVSGVGLNNIGLLVRTTGLASGGSNDGFYMTDGSGVSLFVSLAGAGTTYDGRYVIVTGISALASDSTRVIKARSADDVKLAN